jgi:hypothetical protein
MSGYCCSWRSAACCCGWVRADTTNTGTEVGSEGVDQCDEGAVLAEGASYDHMHIAIRVTMHIAIRVTMHIATPVTMHIATPVTMHIATRVTMHISISVFMQYRTLLAV